MAKLNESYVDNLFEGILQLKSVEECYDFFTDLCTPGEIKSMGRRFTVAKMLSDKRVYCDIVKETGASTATISRVNRSLVNGYEGYKMVFDRMKKDK